MRFPSNKTLGNVVVYGAMACISAVMYMRYRIEDQFRQSEYYRIAVQALRANRGAANLLGEPIKELGFDLSDSKKNYCDGQTAHFEVNVRGSKDRGKIFFTAIRDENSWILEKLDLQLKSQPDKLFLVKKLEVPRAEENMI